MHSLIEIKIKGFFILEKILKAKISLLLFSIKTHHNLILIKPIKLEQQSWKSEQRKKITKKTIWPNPVTCTELASRTVSTYLHIYENLLNLPLELGQLDKTRAPRLQDRCERLWANGPRCSEIILDRNFFTINTMV